MANTIQTNKLTDLVALRFLVAAGFITAGAKEHFKDQMQGRRAGQEYTFVIRDAAPVYDGEEIVAAGGSAAPSSNANGVAIVDGTNLKNNIVEREVKMKLRDFAQFQDTNLIEPVTDMNWDAEVATPNGGKMANKVISKAVKEAVYNATTAIVGTGFQPLSEVAAHLASISMEKMYGFIDPKIQAILRANGQQFQPVGTPDTFYKQGLLGTFDEVEYRSQRFFPVINMPEVTAASLKTANTATAIKVTAGQLQLDLVFAAADNGKVIPAGTPIFVDGVYACDLNGDPTAELYAFILAKDATVANGAATVDVGGKIVGDLTNVFGTSVTANGVTTTSGQGARLMCKENGGVLVAGDFQNKTATTLEKGKYFMGQVRLDGTYEFCTLDKLDSNNAESKLGSVETKDGKSVKVHENRVVNNNTLTNTTRWDVVAMFGTIEPRGVSNIYFKYDPQA